MSVSYQKTLKETGFVDSAELGRPRKINETLMPPYLEEDQSRRYFSCSFQTTLFPTFPRAGLVTSIYTATGQIEADGEESHGLSQRSDSYNSSLFEDTLKS